jgi:serine/threonine protein kinase
VACLLVGLEYLHCNGVMHRDLKPENLVLDENGYVHITDLGIAKLIANDKEIIDSSGTPGYMSPEALNNQHHELCSDFFSVGVIIYEFMNGKVSCPH